MAETDNQARERRGRNVTLAFEYVQQVCTETAQLMRKLDDLMGAGWESRYDNRTTKEVTSHLGHPRHWLVRASFRIYEGRGEPSLRKGITVVYWGNGIEQPILIGGQIDYIIHDESGRLEDDHWDLWSAWFEEEPEDKKIDGTIYRVEPDDPPLTDRVRRARVFALPLVSIHSEEDVRTEVYDRLTDL